MSIDDSHDFKITIKHYMNCPYLLNMHPSYDAENPDYLDLREWINHINKKLEYINYRIDRLYDMQYCGR